MVTAFPGESHKGFRTLEKARLAWHQGPTAGQGSWRPPQPRPALRTPRQGRSPVAPAGVRDGGDSEQVLVAPAVAVQVPIPPDVDLPRSGLHPDAALEDVVSIAITYDQAGAGDFELAELMGHAGDDAGNPDSDEEFYWSEDAVSEDPPAGDVESLLSPTISSVSSLSLTTSPALTAGTISPGLIATPNLFPLAISPHSTPPITSRTLSCPGPETVLREPPPIRIRSMWDRVTGRTPSTPVFSSKSRDSRREPPHTRSEDYTRLTPSSASTTTRSSRLTRSGGAVDIVPLAKPREFFVVIRGDHPGIYMDR